jgi:hypothetical protein
MSTIKSSSEHLTLNADGASKDIKFQANGVEKASISSTGVMTATSYAGDGSALTGISGGKVLQVVSTTKTDTYSTSLAITTQSGDVTGLTAAITPSATSSKVLVTVSLSMDVSSNVHSAYFTVFRGGSISSFVGASPGSRQAVSGATVNGDQGPELSTSTITFLDSPATTSATTYSVRLSHNNGSTTTVYLNRSYGNNDSYYDARSASSITLMEIGV